MPYRNELPPPDFAKLSDETLIRTYRLMQTGVLPFSKYTLMRYVDKGLFPKPILLSKSVTAFRVGDVRKWLANPSEWTNKLLGDNT